MVVPFSPPYISPDVLPNLAEVLASGWITTGAKTKEFEREIAKFVGVESVLCVNSATAGMELVLRWWGIQAGDEVIVPAYTYCATANVILHCGAIPVMVDINPVDLTICTDSLAKKITSRTKAIIGVDLGGMPCDCSKIHAILSAHSHLFVANNDVQAQLGRILFMADGAHSLGAIYHQKPAVLSTDVSVFSFHAVKNMTTAEGGAVAWNLPAGFDKLAIYTATNILTLHGQSKDALAKSQGNGWEYDVEVAGYKWNMPDILAVIGLSGLQYYKDILAKRKEICLKYTDALSRHPLFHCPVFQNPDKESSYHLYPLRIPTISESARNIWIQKLYEKEISTNVHYKPLPLLTLYKKLGYRIEDFPVSHQVFQCEISLPVFFTLTDEQIGYVIDNLMELAEKNI